MQVRSKRSAAAGSSAGAITAAMIAAGMSPSDIGAETERGLRTMATPTKLNAVRRILWGTGFLDQAGVLSWLRTVLCDRVSIAGGTVDERGPSFTGLFDLTGIDLFVAAVDLTARQVAVFHHSLTPRVRVAEAVMASATIPVAFEPLLFGDRGPWRLFVDGGWHPTIRLSSFETRRSVDIRDWASPRPGLPSSASFWTRLPPTGAMRPLSSIGGVTFVAL